MTCILVGVLISFFYLLNANNTDFLDDIKENPPLANAETISMLVIRKCLNITAIRSIFK